MNKPDNWLLVQYWDGVDSVDGGGPWYNEDLLYYLMEGDDVIISMKDDEIIKDLMEHYVQFSVLFHEVEITTDRDFETGYSETYGHFYKPEILPFDYDITKESDND